MRIHQNISEVSLYDIAVAINEIYHLEDEEKIENILFRVQDHILSSHPKILYNQAIPHYFSLSTIYEKFTLFKFGNPEIYHKLEKYLEAELDNKHLNLSSE